jgi:hypothetical protein
MMMISCGERSKIRAYPDETVLAVDDQYETNVVLDGLPEQIDAVVIDVSEFAVDSELRFLEQFGKFKDVRKRHLVFLLVLFTGTWPIEASDTIAFGASNDMYLLAPVFIHGSFEKIKRGTRGIVGIHRGVTATTGPPGFFNQQVCHTGDKGSGFSIETIHRPDGIDALMELCLERETKGFRNRADQEGHNPKMVSKNELRCTAVLGFLME